MKFRKLTTNDIEQYKALRLESLENAPHAFGSTVAHEEKQNKSFFENRINGEYIIGAFDTNALIGVSGLVRHKGVKRSHKSMIWGVYVSPDYRKKGIGKRLMIETLSHTPKEIELVQLGVESKNKFAVRMHESLGFETYGIEKNALKLNDKYYDEMLMVKFIKK